MNETYRKMFLSYANASLSDPGQLAIGEIVFARRLLIIYEEKASKLLNMEQMAINRTPHSLNDSKGERRFMAAWRNEEIDAARHRQEKEKATRLGKL